MDHVQAEIPSIIAIVTLGLLVCFIGIRHQMKIDRIHGRHYKWWQYFEVLGFDLKHRDKDTTRWILAFAIAFTALWVWLIWREFQ
jgi:hypothetical protein